MKNILLGLLFVSTVYTYAQEEATPEFPNAKNSYLSIDISTSINFVTPRYRLGYNKSINKSWRISADLGYGNKAISLKLFNSYKTDKYRLFEARTEVYYILNPTKRASLYVSGELYYINHKEDFLNNHYYTEDRQDHIYFDRATFTRNKYGFNLKFGVLIPFGDKLGMNPYVGAGPRIRNIQYKNLINPRIGTYNDDNEHYGFFDDSYQEAGTKIGFNISLGVKFIFRIP